MVQPINIANHKPSTDYKPEIDGLRAIAVLSVIANHMSGTWFPSGYLGVDVFFVISGYVITGSLWNTERNSLYEFLINFYAKRIKRLVPALSVCVIISGLLICSVDPSPQMSLKTGIASLFGLSNVFLLSHATDYFAADTDLNIFTQTWSLGVEEQFYLIFPLLLWIFLPKRNVQRQVKLFTFLMIGLVAASWSIFLYLSLWAKPAAFFLMPARFWELGAGCCLYLSSRSKTTHSTSFSVPSLSFLLLMCAMPLLPSRFGILATGATIILTLLLIGTVRPPSISYRLLTAPAATHVGKISYSLYLWHWPVVSISQWTIGIHWWSAPAQIFLIYLLATGSHRYVEKPLRYAKWSSYNLLTISYGVSGAMLSAIVLLTLAKPLQGQLFLGDRFEEASTTFSSFPNVINPALALIQKCNMTPNLLAGANYRPKPMVDQKFVQDCIGTQSVNKKLVLVGDSFAEVSAPYLAVIANKLGYEFRVIFGYGCPYPLPLAQMKSRANEMCEQLDENILRERIVDGLKQGDLLVLRIDLPKIQYLDYSKEMPSVDAYDFALKLLGDAVNAKGAKLLLIGANPTLTVGQLRSLQHQWFNLSGGAQDVSNKPSDNQMTSYFHLNDEHLKKIGNSLGISFFSLRPYLCDQHMHCKLSQDSKILYTDAEHLSPFAHDLFFNDLLLHVSRAAYGDKSP